MAVEEVINKYYEENADDNTTCSVDNKQLAEWLKEWQELKRNNNSIEKMEKVKNTNTTKTNKSMSNKMFSKLIDCYKSQLFPEKEEGVKVSIDGALCVPVNAEYIGVKPDGSLTSYSEQVLIDVPVYSINKPQVQVKVGDIVKIGTRYGRVNTKNTDGSLEIIYFNGVSENTHEIKDMLLGQSLVRVLVNMFNFNESNNINPMLLLAMADKEDIDMKSLILMQAISSGQGFGGNYANGFNPMLLLALGDENSKNNDMLTTLALMQMMNGGNGFFNNPSNTPSNTTSNK